MSGNRPSTSKHAALIENRQFRLHHATITKDYLLDPAMARTLKTILTLFNGWFSYQGWRTAHESKGHTFKFDIFNINLQMINRVMRRMEVRWHMCMRREAERQRVDRIPRETGNRWKTMIGRGGE